MNLKKMIRFLIKFPGTARLAKELWEQDSKKLIFAKEQDFEVLTIWESDYKQDPIKVVDKCLDFFI